MNMSFSEQQYHMATLKETTPQWRTTVIVSTSLQKHETNRMLSAQQHRIRFSDSVDPGTFIFPLSDLPGPFEESGLFERIETFVQVHRNSFLLLYAPFNGRKELDILSAIQHRFLGSNLKVLPVRNNAEIVNGMLTIAKATSKPHADSVSDMMSLAQAHVTESSPVWEMLRDQL
uniref:protein SPO16 homolog isoform X2 n=1 Tax=Scatophagus argus TaxID=75038 RepID=UPI001ED7DB06|nr:protein SPO16 homolog isoform X2 [Scatophagus argus]